MDGTLAIVDPDESYGRRLSLALAGRIHRTVIPFSAAESLEEYAGEHPVAAILDGFLRPLEEWERGPLKDVPVIWLIGESAGASFGKQGKAQSGENRKMPSGECGPAPDGEHVAGGFEDRGKSLFGEHEAVPFGEHETVPSGSPGMVWKYQPVEKIARDLQRLLRDFLPEGENRFSAADIALPGSRPQPEDRRKEPDADGEENLRAPGIPDAAARCKIIGIWSPCGRCGKTSFALTCAEAAARKENVLYLNFEEFSGLSALFPDAAGGATLADAVFESQAGTLTEHLDRLCLRWHGVSVLRPVPYPEDLFGVPEEHYVGVLIALRDCAQFDRIILEAGSCMRLVLRLLPLCWKIYVPLSRDACGEERQKTLEQWFSGAERKSLEHRVRYLQLPEPEGSFRGRLSLESLLCTSFGSTVKKILQRENEADSGE